MLLVDTRSVPGRLQKNHLKEHKSRNFSKEEKDCSRQPSTHTEKLKIISLTPHLNILPLQKFADSFLSKVQTLKSLKKKDIPTLSTIQLVSLRGLI